MKPMLHLLLLSFLVLSGHAMEPRKRILIDEVVTITNVRGTLEQLRADNVALFRGLIEQAMAESPNPAYRQRLVERTVEKYSEYSHELFSWLHWEDVYVSHYDGNYTEPQLKALISFLKTDTGQAMQRAQVDMTRKMQLQLAEGGQASKERIDRLMQEAIKETEAEVRAASEQLRSIPASELEEKARAGDAIAQYQLGENYATGTGVEKNPIEAIRWLRMAADQGHLFAKSRLGWCFYSGEGVDKDPERARDYFLQAANGGDIIGMYFLGFMLARGDGVPKDTPQGFTWLLKAANAGHVNAQYEVAILYWNGDGVEKSPSEAYAWILVADDSDLAAANEFQEFMRQRINSDQMADAMMRSSEIRRAIKAHNNSK